MKQKKMLIRIVKSPDIEDETGTVISKAEISLDTTGKKPGRGAYICPDINCFQKAKKAKRLERTFKAQIPSDIYKELEEQLAKER